jgi:hypothetical protein
VRLILEIEDDATSPRGQLSVEGQPPRAFSGWMQLGEAIEAAVAIARDSRQAAMDSRKDDGLPPPGAPGQRRKGLGACVVGVGSVSFCRLSGWLSRVP